MVALIEGVTQSGEILPVKVSETGELVIGGLELGEVEISGGINQSQVQSAIEAAKPFPVTGPLTDSELRASAILAALFTTATIGNVSTSSSGDQFVALEAGSCRAVDLVNPSQVAVEYRRDGSGAGLTIPAGSARLLIGVSNSNQISVRRSDQSNTPVSLNFERLS